MATHLPEGRRYSPIVQRTRTEHGMPWWLECLTLEDKQGQDSLLCMHEWRLAGITTQQTCSQYKQYTCCRCSSILPAMHKWNNDKIQWRQGFGKSLHIKLKSQKPACIVNTGTVKTPDNILHIALNQTLVCRSHSNLKGVCSVIWILAVQHAVDLPRNLSMLINWYLCVTPLIFNNETALAFYATGILNHNNMDLIYN